MWQTDRQTDGQSYDSQDRPRICSRGKNCWIRTRTQIATKLWSIVSCLFQKFHENLPRSLSNRASRQIKQDTVLLQQQSSLQSFYNTIINALIDNNSYLWASGDKLRCLRWNQRPSFRLFIISGSHSPIADIKQTFPMREWYFDVLHSSTRVSVIFLHPSTPERAYPSLISRYAADWYRPCFKKFVAFLPVSHTVERLIFLRPRTQRSVDRRKEGFGVAAPRGNQMSLTEAPRVELPYRSRPGISSSTQCRDGRYQEIYSMTI